jgi:RNA polymerase sigma-70 factor (ECF subfamily)
LAHHRDSPTAQLSSAPGSAPDDCQAHTTPSIAPDPAHPSDAVLVALALRDPLAFAPLYQRYVAPIYRYCYRQTSDPDLATDLTAQIFTRALEALPKFTIRDSSSRANSTTGSTFRSWLFTIAHNAVIDVRRRARPSVSLDDRHHHIADSERGPEDQAVLRDELDRLIAILDRIPAGQRQIIELRLAGLSAAEIATALSLSRPAVKSAQTRAYARLRELLGPPASPSTSQEPTHDRA